MRETKYLWRVLKHEYLDIFISRVYVYIYEKGYEFKFGEYQREEKEVFR